MGEISVAIVAIVGVGNCGGALIVATHRSGGERGAGVVGGTHQETAGYRPEWVRRFEAPGLPQIETVGGPST